MAHYAKISNDEFTVNERARLIEAQNEKNVIEANNKASDEEVEALTSEITALNTTISNSLCRVILVYTGVDELVTDGYSMSLQTAIDTLEEKKKNVSDEAEIIDINNQIRVNQEAIPLEKDNTVYWEKHYGGCKRTSYNTKGGVHKLGGTPFRKNYAGVGHIYDPVRDAFYEEQPYASWTLNESTCYWEAPTPRPENGEWYWKEDTTEWIEKDK